MHNLGWHFYCFHTDRSHTHRPASIHLWKASTWHRGQLRKPHQGHHRCICRRVLHWPASRQGVKTTHSHGWSMVTLMLTTTPVLSARQNVVLIALWITFSNSLHLGLKSMLSCKAKLELYHNCLPNMCPKKHVAVKEPDFIALCNHHHTEMQHKNKLHQSNISERGRAPILIAVLLCFLREASEQSCLISE